MKEEKKERRGTLDYVYIVQRLVTILAIVAAFFPAFSPSRIDRRHDFIVYIRCFILKSYRRCEQSTSYGMG